MFGKRDKTDQAKKKRVRLHETTHENDIRYRGRISGQHFKMLGWLCIVVAQVAVLLKLGGRIRRGLRRGQRLVAEHPLEHRRSGAAVPAHRQLRPDSQRRRRL